MDINLRQLNLTRGSSYLPLPDWLASKKVIINPKNADQECFKWAVIAALQFQNIESHPERISNLNKFSNNYDWSGLVFPVSFRDISKFEFRNQISISLLAAEGKEIYICRKGGNYEGNRSNDNIRVQQETLRCNQIYQQVTIKQKY